MSRAIQAALIAVPLCYWLFADTVRRQWPAGGESPAIRFAFWGGFDDYNMWREVIEAFHRTNPGVTVRPEWQPLSGYNQKIRQQLLGGVAPDVFMFQDEPFPIYAREQFAPIDAWIENDAEARAMLEDCWPTALDSFRLSDSLRGVPIMGGTVLVYCNLEAFDRAALVRGEAVPIPDADWTLEDFAEMCRRLTIDENADGRIDQFGFLQPHWVYYLPFIWSHGASLLDETRTRWALDGPPAVAAFGFYADLRHRWGVTPMPVEYAGQNSDTAFLSGRVAMCVNGPWFQAFLRETRLRDRVRVVPIPRGPGGNATRVTWDALCISAAVSENRQRSAWKFARFCLTADAQRRFASRLRAVPVRRAVAAEYVRAGGGPGSPAQAFVDSLATARLQPVTPNWNRMSAAVRRHLNSVLLPGKRAVRPEDAVRALASDPAISTAFGGDS